MLAVERRRLIAESIRSRGVVSVAEMAETLGTTEITLRRDLRAMAKDGLLVRTHGGAVQADLLTTRNPAAILADLPTQLAEPLELRTSLLDRLRRFLKSTDQ